jgi:hypothetical protein
MCNIVCKILIGYLFFHRTQIMNNALNIPIITKTELSVKKIISILKKNQTDGNDHRVLDKTEYPIENIIKNAYKYKLFEHLQNPKISLFEKLIIIEQIETDSDSDSKYLTNICNGGLFKDWE